MYHQQYIGDTLYTLSSQQRLSEMVQTSNQCLNLPLRSTSSATHSTFFCFYVGPAQWHNNLNYSTFNHVEKDSILNSPSTKIRSNLLPSSLFARVVPIL